MEGPEFENRCSASAIRCGHFLPGLTLYSIEQSSNPAGLMAVELKNPIFGNLDYICSQKEVLEYHCQINPLEDINEMCTLLNEDSQFSQMTMRFLFLDFIAPEK